jgi:hypothetical protein
VKGFGFLTVVALASFILGSGIPVQAVEQPLGSKSLIRLPYDQYEKLVGLGARGLDMAGARPGEWADLVVTPDFYAQIRAMGIRSEIIHGDLEAYERRMAGTYHSYSGMVTELQRIANTYPSIAKLFDLGAAYQGNHIYALKISDNVNTEDPTEPDVFFFGEHHAREWPSMEIPLFYCDTLTKAYASNQTIRDLVNSREIWIVPTVNPDGHVYSHDQGRDWRKNRHYFSEWNSWGVDLNRNYDGAVNGDKQGGWGSIPGSNTTHYSTSEVYCGPGPLSEIETQTLANLFKAHNFVISVSYHTYSELFMWAWGYTSSTPPDNTLLVQMGTEAASRISRQGGGTYTPRQSVGLYPTSGTSEDWIYGYALYADGTNCLAYIVEACNQFQPPQSALDQILRENFDGALYLLQQAQYVSDALTPRVMPPVIDVMGTDPDGNYTVSWTQTNPEANPDYYELQELTGLSRITEGAEGGSSLWTMEGFTVSSAQAHSGSNSFHSNLTAANSSSAMTLKNAFPVNAGDSLSFWCSYNIENRYDYAYAEVSLNGREWTILGDFTSNSGGWVRKSYSLAPYVGKSIFVRFRYITDDNTAYSGFYVDDISPIGKFSSIVTLSNHITTTSYDVTGRGTGTYWYQVRGHNTARGWGDYSVLEDMVVTGTPNVSLALSLTSPDPHHRGGQLTYDALFANNTSSTQTVYYWAQVTLPNHRTRRAVPAQAITVPVPSYTKSFAHTIPTNAPYGSYTYTGYISTTPYGPLMGQDSFTFNIQAE